MSQIIKLIIPSDNTLMTKKKIQEKNIRTKT